MINSGHQATPGQGWGGLMEQMTGLPSPEKVLAEIRDFKAQLERLNGNIEKLQPDMHKLASAIEGLNAGDVRRLTDTLQAAKLGESIKAVGEVSKVIKRFGDKLLGPS